MDNSRTSTTSRKKPNMMMMMAMASHGQTIPESSHIAAVQCALLKRLNSTHKKNRQVKAGKKERSQNI